ncbi:MAG: hypothetical protein A3K77_00825 [Euryarchaeota archaeon RBG_13_31_8]|nr:MAG: hypothetical protein A3K77_00825 [Euryarchaeota archaeon RBG_13_31_8]
MLKIDDLLVALEEFNKNFGGREIAIIQDILGITIAKNIVSVKARFQNYSAERNKQNNLNRVIGRS